MYPGHWASVFPDKPALIDSASGAVRTFGELDVRSNRIARFCHAMGLRRGDHIAVFMENHIALFDVIWAALRSGLYLTTVNRYLTAEEAGYIVDNCGAKVMVTTDYLMSEAKDLRQYAPNCDHFLTTGPAESGYRNLDEAVADYPGTALAEQPLGSFMLYSSGTTGRPKGIKRPLADVQVDEQGAPTGDLHKLLWGFDEQTVYLSPAPMYHSAPLSFSTAAQQLGGTVVMMPKFDPEAALAAIEAHRITHSQWVPTMFSRMLKLPEDVRTRYDLSSLKVAIHAAAPCPREVKKQMLDWWGDVIYEYYAGTELNGFTHVTPQEWRERPGTVGKPLIGVIRICDEDGTELPPGREGIVYFEQDVMPFEYHDAPDKTKEAQHPQHANWTALGDVGYVDEDGYLFLTDRATFMIISGGVNIYPQEIEDAMILHPKVADVAVIGVPNPDMGEEVKAVVQPAEGVEPSDALAAELIEFARQHIAHYKCPRSIDFEAELPRLPTGKLYKRLLKDRYWGRHDTKIV